MMARRHLALLTAFAAASATASAAPKHEAHRQRVRYDTPEPAPGPRHDGWILLASPTPVRYGTVFIVVDERANRMARLRIDANTGKVNLLQIRLFFDDGIRTLALGRTLDRRHNSTVIDVPSTTPIRQIAITTARVPPGTYTVYASSGETGIAMR